MVCFVMQWSTTSCFAVSVMHFYAIRSHVMPNYTFYVVTIIIIIMGQVSLSLLPEFAWLNQSLQIFRSLIVFRRSSTAKFVSPTSTSMYMICEANLDELSHELASTELVCCMVVVQREHNCQRASSVCLWLLRSVEEGLDITPRWSYAVGSRRSGLFVAVFMLYLTVLCRAVLCFAIIRYSSRATMY